MSDNRNIIKDGIMGVVIGDALGCPVQFKSRIQVAKYPVTGMRGYETFNLPEGSWTDDSSLTLALQDSINRKGEIDLHDIMHNFMKWLYDGEFTPYGKSFDIGRGVRNAIDAYRKNRKPYKCGSDSQYNNGNGSLMRILPACLFCYRKQKDMQLTDTEAVKLIHEVGGLTHAHIRANIACGLYYFMVKAALDESGSLKERLACGLAKGFAFYEGYLADTFNLTFYDRLRDTDAFAMIARDKIESSGYVVDTLEAAVWCLFNEDNFDKSLLLAVNLGEDTDTVGAVAGGLAGLYYGYEAIPEQWLSVIKRREWIEQICEAAGSRNQNSSDTAEKINVLPVAGDTNR